MATQPVERFWLFIACQEALLSMQADNEGRGEGAARTCRQARYVCRQAQVPLVLVEARLLAGSHGRHQVHVEPCAANTVP